MNIDCQIRGKSDIHEALATMCEVEVMEGDNQVNCERCKKNTDTVLQTAISRLPNMLVLSLKRFDLDYNTFETVKINSRCSFDQTLNMKRYTLEGVEMLEQAEKARTEEDKGGDSDAAMVEGSGGQASTDAEALDDPLSSLPDEDYEYRLAGVLIHAGVAQGGHYYSFIRDRGSSNQGRGDNGGDKWYRFDDEDVTPFDPSLIEQECFGGKVKKEQKWSDGRIHTVETEQFSNALMLFYEKVKPAENGSKVRNNAESEPKDAAAKDSDVPMDVEDANAKAFVKTSGFDAFQPDVQRSNKMQSWLDFLMNADFQHLLKVLIDSCLVPPHRGEAGSDGGSGSDVMDLSADEGGEAMLYSPWNMALLQTVVSYVFDILLHSPDKSVLKEWERKMAEVLRISSDGARLFVHELASRTRAVSSNWLRTYCTDCPEKFSREAAVRIFFAGIQSCAKRDQETHLLQQWTRAWQVQVGEDLKYLKEHRRVKVVSSSLGEHYESLEDVTKLGAEASGIGVIISYLAELLDFAPRTWRHCSELFCLIRDMACADGESGALLKEALIEAQILPRLVCLTGREHASDVARFAFPGPSMRSDLAEVLTKPETAPSTHNMMTMGNTHGTSHHNGPSPSDLCHLFEAIGVIIGSRCLVLDPVLVERREPGKSTTSFELTKRAAEAIIELYNEQSGDPNIGMSYNRLATVLGWSLPDETENGIQQRATKIFNACSTRPIVDRGRDIHFLTAEGLLEYFQDRAREVGQLGFIYEMHCLGFRPDLTQRAFEHRAILPHNATSPTYMENHDSVALDVASICSARPSPLELGTLAQHALNSFSLYNAATSVHEAFGEYLLAFSAYGSDCRDIIREALANFAHAADGWSGSEQIVLAKKVGARKPRVCWHLTCWFLRFS